MTKLKKILLERKISQRKLQRLISEKCITPLGVDRISQIVNGKTTNYSLFTLLKICIALDITPNELIDKDSFLENECKK